MSRRSGALEVEVANYLNRCSPFGDCLVRPNYSESGPRRYGTIRFDSGKQVSAHRGVYLVKVGPIPAGAVVRHACDRPGCVNPEHLLAGTYSDNEQDKNARGRATVGLRHPRAVIPPAVIAEALQRHVEGQATIADLSRELGVSRSSIRRWLDGACRPDVPRRWTAA